MRNLGQLQVHISHSTSALGEVVLDPCMGVIMSHLSERERQIDFTREGISAARIALRVNCSLRTVRRVRKRFRETGEWSRKVGSGAPKKTTARQDRALGRLVHTARFPSLGELTYQISQTLPSPVSQVTVRRRLHAMGTHNRAAVRKPLT